jgi:hypothetical protein
MTLGGRDDRGISELEVEESDPLFFAGQGRSRLANQARAICAVVLPRRRPF